MESKIIFLGTAGDTITTGKQLRGSGGIILHIEDFQFHLDPGPGASLRARQFNINPRNNTAIISTNNSLLCAGGLNEIISAMTHDGLDKKGVIIGNDSVINETEKNDPLLNKFYRNCVEKFIAIKPGQKVGINTTEIHAIKAFNDKYPAFGLKFITPKFILTYSSLTKYNSELLNEYKDSTILILNASYPLESEKTDLLNLNDIIKILEEIKPKLCILTNFGIKSLNSDPLYESREIQKRTETQVIAAKDGMVISPNNYSANQIQKTLNFYPASK